MKRRSGNFKNYYSYSISINAPQLAEVADLEAQIFGTGQMMIEARHLDIALHPQFWQGAVTSSSIRYSSYEALKKENKKF